MNRATDLIGQRFGKLTVIEKAERPKHIKNKRAYWHVVCDCGNEKIVGANNLKIGDAKSCGENSCKEKAVKHGECQTRLYHIWDGMKQRCYNSNNCNYKRYGGKGIKICNEWSEYIFFRDWALANGYADNLTIDRIDNSKNYSLENCQWLTNEENCSKDSKGEKNSHAKLTEKEVIIIRKIGDRIERKYLASFFDISISALDKIIHYDTWKHITI